MESVRSRPDGLGPDGGAAFACEPPPLLFDGRRWSSQELSGIARGWQGVLREGAPPSTSPVAMVMSNHPEAVALFFALSSFHVPLILLPPDPRAWGTEPPMPPGTPLVLHPAGRSLAAAATQLSLAVTVLPEPGIADGPWPFFAFPGVVALTSGSTGRAKPVYRTTEGLLAEAETIVEAHGLRAGGGVLGALPLAFAGFYGLSHVLMVATLRRSALALLERFEHRTVLDHLASGGYDYWPATPMMVDILGRCPLSTPPPRGPAVCAVSGTRLALSAFRAFSDRFGVPPRPEYGMAEAGTITMETAPAAEVRPEAVGQPIRGVGVCIGDDPGEAFPSGKAGRVWVRSPWCMQGYGFPPRLEPRPDRGGWWATGDIGVLDETGYLSLMGRIDDRFKTVGGYLVNPTEIARVLTSHPGVTEAVVVPVASPRGTVIGALVEGDQLDPTELRYHAARALPLSAQPWILVTTTELPRTAGGKIDRRACIAMLEHRHTRGGVR